MDVRKTDVLIVGGGPAGSSVAYTLATQGIRALVLEKQRMPRYKTCGGGVNVRAAKLLPFSIEPVVERTIYTYRFTFKGQRPFTRSYPEPLTYMTQRMRLDQYLLDQARSAGAEVEERVTIRKIEQTPDGIRALADSGACYDAQVVVGADGANSVVARDLGLMRDVRHELALESEIALSHDLMDAWGDTVEIDLFSVWCGYGWVFPKEKHISIGVGGLRKDVRTLQRYNHQYLERHQVDAVKPLRFSGHALPVRLGRSTVVQGRGLLVGDAAGLLEPFTGEGIGYAIRSGQLAGRAIGDFINGHAQDLLPYSQLLDTEVTPDLVNAERYVRVFNRFPGLFYRLVRDNDYVWKAACLILRGERNYSDIDRRLGILKHVLALF